MNKIKPIVVIFFLIFVTLPNLFAKIYIEEATYNMGDDDSKITAQHKAILVAKRAGIEKAGVYTSSYSKAVHGVLKDDVIESFSASIVKATLLERKFNYPKYWVRVQIDVDVELLNKKIKEFQSQDIHVEDQIKSARDEIDAYNAKLEELLKSRNQTKELKKLQERKKLLLQKVTDLENGKEIQLQIQKDEKYAYIDIISNVKNSEIYLNNKYIGIAPIKKYKVVSDTKIVIKAINDKRYYPKDVVITKYLKKLSVSDIKINFTKGQAKLFLIGANDSMLYINNHLIKKLNNSNRTITVKSGKIQLSILNKDGCFLKDEDIWADGVYEIVYNFDIDKCSLINTDIVNNGTIYKAIISPYTQRVWLDRNLGAKRVCRSFDDKLCFGDYFQWGRSSDGHEKLESLTSTKVSKSSKPNHTYFIIGDKELNNNWFTKNDNNLWKKYSANNPCPTAFRVPTMKELMAETLKRGIDNRQKVFSSFLKIPASGYRYRKDANLYDNKVSSDLYSSDTETIYAKILSLTKRHIKEENILKGNGVAVRCIQNIEE